MQPTHQLSGILREYVAKHRRHLLASTNAEACNYLLVVSKHFMQQFFVGWLPIARFPPNPNPNPNPNPTPNLSPNFSAEDDKVDTDDKVMASFHCLPVVFFHESPSIAIRRATY